ncbi:sulfite exporter TauE/SafE family protein [Occallatibacter riparius]|uniref:Sulfite exporter TauE/SafE family protein n=1 Tax=Occallatibacter riparius TaxID=1002689 RepID=A0A9J7BWE0_9BACT|nr:sulfite exporter TauE/SafE family protein [Occallatibacter riparius]
MPILLGTAISMHRRAPIALAAGLAVSYTAIGTILARSGAALGFGPGIARILGAVVLGLFALILLSSELQQRFVIATSRIANTGNWLLSRVSLNGIYGQFVIGIALGMIWSPCVGPTLGTAIVLASQGNELLSSAALMSLFSLGAVLPIVLLAYISRSATIGVRDRLAQAGSMGKAALGSLMLVIAIATVTGKDRLAEAWFVEHSPVWLTSLTTRF